MTKRIDWVQCDQCDEEEGRCPVCDGSGMVPIFSFTPEPLKEADPWQEIIS